MVKPMAAENERETVAAPVPFAVFECTTASMNTANRRLWIAVLALIFGLVISNSAWLYAWMSYDYVSETVTVESTASGHANFVGAGGNIYNGENHRETPEANP